MKKDEQIPVNQSPDEVATQIQASMDTVVSVPPDAPPFDDMTGKTISHYSVRSKLGVGGMASVYQAQDQKLSRLVALKFLHPHLAGVQEYRARFFREALAVSRLNHPNIATVYEVNSDAVFPFIALEYIDGGTLRGIMGRRLDLERLYDLGIQIGRALNHAHLRGIVHRDLKPENVLLTGDGGSKLTDFGIAKVVGETELTEHGAVMGTPSYMSPEQVLGLPLDSRTDVYSFGVLLFELASGKLPYPQDGGQGIRFQIVKGKRISLSELRDDAPKALGRTLGAMLEPELEKRSVTLNELENIFESLRRGLTPELPQEKNSRPIIAVLPLVDLSPERNQNYFCDGLADEIIYLLGQINDVRVVARSSSFAFRDKTEDVRELGRQLSADFVLEGSIRCAGDRMRLAVQLVNAADGCHVWSKRYDRQLSDVFAVQEEVAQTIVESCREGLTQDLKLVARTATDPEAYACYLRGLAELNRQTVDAVQDAVGYFQQSLQLDPQFAPTLTGLSQAYSTLGWYGAAAPTTAIGQARRYAEEALKLDKGQAMAHCTLAIIKARHDWDWDAAMREFREVLRVSPGAASGHFHYALDCLTPVGNLEEAQAEIEFAWKLDPLSPLLNTAIGGCLHRRRLYEKAVQHLKKTVEFAPTFAHAHWSLARSLEQLGEREDARTCYEKALSLSPGNPGLMGELGGCLGRFGWRTEAESILEKLHALQAAKYVDPYCLGMVHLGLNQHERALDNFEKAVEQRAASITWAGIEPRFAPLAHYPRFQKLLQAMRLPPRHDTATL